MNFTTLMNKNYEELVFNLIFPRKLEFHIGSVHDRLVQVQVDKSFTLGWIT